MMRSKRLLKIHLASAAWLVVLAAPATATVIDIPPAPDRGDQESVGPGTTVNLSDGGAIGFNFNMDDATLNISGGTIKSLSVDNGSIVTMTGGEITGGLFADSGSQVFVSDGKIGGRLNAHSGILARIEGGEIGSLESDFSSQVTFAGGTILGSIQASDEGVIHVTGGRIEGGAYNDDNGVIHIRGGEILGEMSVSSAASEITGGVIRGPASFLWMDVDWSGGLIEGGLQVRNSRLNLIGDQFTFGGAPLGGVLPGGSLLIDRRDATLAGVLADGSPFSIDLTGSGVDQFDELAVLTVTLVPEPTSALSLGVAWLGLSLRARRAAG